MSNVYEMFNNLPSSWSTADLGDLLERITNGMNANQSKVPLGLPISRIETISQGVVNFERVQYVTGVDEKKLEHFSLRKGDILFSHINSDIHLGKTAVFQSDKPLLHGINLLLLRTKSNLLNPKYLHYILNLYRASGLFMAIAQHAVNQSSLNQTKIKSLKIPLPPRIEDQQQIVAEIEKQFSRLDEAVTVLKRIQANLKRYKAAVLKAAVEGKLTEQWRKDHPDVEPADQLLKHILAERRAKWEVEELAKMKTKGIKPKDDSWKKKYKEPAGPDTANLPELPELPEGWVWASVEQLGDVFGGLTKNPKRGNLPLQLPYLRVANVYANKLRLDEIEHIGIEDKERAKLLVITGDLLIVEGNGSPEQIGRVAIWDGSIEPCVHQNHLIKVRLSAACLPKWALYWLLSPNGRNYIREISSSTSGLYTLSVGKVSGLPIPLPSLTEQKQMADDIDRRLSVTEELETTTETNLKRAERLRQRILQKTFCTY